MVINLTATGACDWHRTSFRTIGAQHTLLAKWTPRSFAVSKILPKIAKAVFARHPARIEKSRQLHNESSANLMWTKKSEYRYPPSAHERTARKARKAVLVYRSRAVPLS